MLFSMQAIIKPNIPVFHLSIIAMVSEANWGKNFS
jgi:hypothetical protein